MRVLRRSIVRIGELAGRSGITRSAIRYYERQGLLENVGRRSGVRVFSAMDEKRLSLIQLAQRAGFSIAELRELLHGFGRARPSVRWRRFADAKRQDLLDSMAESQRMLAVLDRLLECECPTLDDCGARFQESKTRS